MKTRPEFVSSLGRRRLRLAWLGWPPLLCLLAFGCAVGPNYHRPDLHVPGAFADATNNAAPSFAELPWWRLFRDPALQELITEALTNNYDLRIAWTRMEQARALAAQNRAAFFPQLTYQGIAERGKNSANGIPTATGKTVDLFALEGSASWELDIWGRLRRLNEAARAQYLATREAQRDVRISLISQVAQAYFELAALDAQLEIAERATNAFGESLRIFSERLQHGVTSRLETSAAEAAQASAAASIPDLLRRIALQENQINTLLGKYSGSIRRSHQLSQTLPLPEVPPGLPSELLERRPDIREAEQNLRAANAQVGVAVADFFPRLSLTGLFGQVSPELSAFTSGAANAWSVGANLAGPLFQGGRLYWQYRQARAAREQAVLQYQSTVLNGFHEVADALVSRRFYAEQRGWLERSVKAYETAVQVSFERYHIGQSSYYEVLQEQQQLYPAENSVVQAELNQLLDIIQLYRALGGGWETAQHQPEHP